MIIWSKWQAFAQKLFLFQARTILTIFYFLFIAPLGLVLKNHSEEQYSSWTTKSNQHISAIDALRKQ